MTPGPTAPRAIRDPARTHQHRDVRPLRRGERREHDPRRSAGASPRRHRCRRSGSSRARPQVAGSTIRSNRKAAESAQRTRGRQGLRADDARREEVRPLGMDHLDREGHRLAAALLGHRGCIRPGEVERENGRPAGDALGAGKGAVPPRQGEGPLGARGEKHAIRRRPRRRDQAQEGRIALGTDRQQHASRDLGGGHCARGCGRRGSGRGQASAPRRRRSSPRPRRAPSGRRSPDPRRRGWPGCPRTGRSRPRGPAWRAPPRARLRSRGRRERCAGAGRSLGRSGYRRRSRAPGPAARPRGSPRDGGAGRLPPGRGPSRRPSGARCARSPQAGSARWRCSRPGPARASRRRRATAAARSRWRAGSGCQVKARHPARSGPR